MIDSEDAGDTGDIFADPWSDLLLVSGLLPLLPRPLRLPRLQSGLCGSRDNESADCSRRAGPSHLRGGHGGGVEDAAEQDPYVGGVGDAAGDGAEEPQSEPGQQSGTGHAAKPAGAQGTPHNTPCLPF